MQDPANRDGFAAVKAKWKQNAHKFGSPLPSSVSLKQRMATGDASEGSEEEECTKPDSFNKKVSAGFGAGESPYPAGAPASARLQNGTKQRRHSSALAGWKTAWGTASTDTKNKGAGAVTELSIASSKDPSAEACPKEQPAPKKKMGQRPAFRQSGSNATDSSLLANETGEARGDDEQAPPKPTKPGKLWQLSSFVGGDDSATPPLEKTKDPLTPPTDIETEEKNEKDELHHSPERSEKDWWLAQKEQGKFKSSYHVEALLSSTSTSSEEQPAHLHSQSSHKRNKTKVAAESEDSSSQVGKLMRAFIPGGATQKEVTTSKKEGITLSPARNRRGTPDDLPGVPESLFPKSPAKKKKPAAVSPSTSPVPPKSPGKQKNTAAPLETYFEPASSAAAAAATTPKTVEPPKITAKTKKSDPLTPRLPPTRSAPPSFKREALNKKQSGDTQTQSFRRRGQKQQAIRERQRSKDESFADLPVFKHTDAEEDTILQALYNRDVFATVTTGRMKHLVAAFEKTHVTAGDIIVHEGDTENDYFYIMERGIVDMTLNDHHLAICQKGDSFGELTLLYDCPSAVTIMALEDCNLFRIDGDSFRAVLESECKRSQKKKLRLLQGIHFLEHVSARAVKLIAEAMTPRELRSDELVVEKGQEATAFYVVSEGRLKFKDGNTTPFQTGDYFGESDLATGESVRASVVALTESVIFSISKEVLEKALGSMSDVILKDQDVRCLSQIPFIKGAVGSQEQIAALADSLRDKRFAAREEILVEREVTKAALYLVREGSVVIKRTSSSGDLVEEAVTSGSHFGGTLMQRAHGKSKRSTKSPYSVTATEKGVDVAILSVKDFWSVVDPSRLATKEKSQKEDTAAEDPTNESSPANQRALAPLPVPQGVEVKKANLQKHVILGEGTFGQVWLVSDRSSKEGEPRTYALKIQSKSFLVDENQVEAVIQEKIMMENLTHPFLIRLFTTYQDSKFVYMVFDFVQGGELFSLMHEEESFDFAEEHAKFYALCIADVIAYLHRGKYVYRDLKPENVMIDARGFVKLIDFGFCKYLLGEKTYTLCGTPGYLAPEVVTMEGHDFSADLWSLGILIYEMITGESPFYYDGIDQMELFESIVLDPYKPPPDVSQEADDIMGRLLVKDPSRRLGASGENHVVEHSWFADLDLDALRRRDPSIRVPWTPEVNGPLDTRYFSDWSELEREAEKDISSTGDHSKKGQLLSERDAKIFEGVF